MPLQKNLKAIFEAIKPHCDNLIVEDFNTEDKAFICLLKAAFAKNYEFNCLCNQLKHVDQFFFIMPSLRGICEDLIAIKYIKEHIKIERNKLISIQTEKRTIEGTLVQKSFFDENRPGQIILEIRDAQTRVDSLSHQIKDILIKNGLKGDKEFPSVAQMATDTKLIKLYNYMYYATSKTVHFEPGLLLRLGWSNSLESKLFTFSTKNFTRYHADFCSYYAAYLFIEFYKAFKKDLGLDVLFKKQIKEITDLLEDELRMPEIVTFEECNIKPPSVITQLLLKSSKKLSHK
ncbi:DUF5677 domain-containing protein [Mucilaginibacter paludis]|uniref:Uncharacterized protein n=1 Tax=Mucilaginibacter paludis DSM 18603 TaxID=714943 RepID=H1YEA0_9SPHI|nr:DUF5677 domain-containing protein [Mucilaginibacter paludis]EHQ26163.1 hypothetical protein Mucpa_2023 [Mucilaginibacter paludis DSM 18603]